MGFKHVLCFHTKYDCDIQSYLHDLTVAGKINSAKLVSFLSEDDNYLARVLFYNGDRDIDILIFGYPGVIGVSSSEINDYVF